MPIVDVFDGGEVRAHDGFRHVGPPFFAASCVGIAILGYDATNGDAFCI